MRSSPYLIDARFTVVGLNLRTWFALHEAGSWTFELQTSDGLVLGEGMFESNADNLRLDSDNRLVGDDPNANLYLSITLDPDFLPKTYYVALISRDFANQSKTFSFHPAETLR